MNENSQKSFDSRNRKKEITISTSSKNELMEKNENNKIEEEKIIGNKNAIIQESIKFLKNNDDIGSSSSRRSSENKILLEKNEYFRKNTKNSKHENKSNYEKSYENKNKSEAFIYLRKNYNKNNKPINFNETENYIYEGEEINKNKINQQEHEKENNKGILSDEIFNLIIGYNFDKVIKSEYIEKFFLLPLPENRTLSMNVNKLKKTEVNASNFYFKYNLEIIRNNQIYFFARVKQSFPSSNIKIYVKSPNNVYTKVGKIISNLLKNDFTLFKGDNKSNYEKILNITYETNFFGNKLRKMVVDKFENNRKQYTLVNDLPEWDEFYKTYKLNFNGRVKQRSKKNFILKYQNANNSNNKEDEIENEKLLQCGKIDDFCYALDFITPLSPFEAFSISITSIISKISCD